MAVAQLPLGPRAIAKELTVILRNGYRDTHTNPWVDLDAALGAHQRFAGVLRQDAITALHDNYRGGGRFEVWYDFGQPTADGIRYSFRLADHLLLNRWGE